MAESIYEQFSSLVENVLTEEEILKMKPFFDNISQSMNNNANFSFTELQKEVIQNKEFWNSSSEKNNIIIQGATSAGKTLVSEMNMAYQIYCKGKNVLYLVHLRALTTEKQSNFEKHFQGYRIYSSSSDYQEHDSDLKNGNFDIGILVYEKFFALLAENSKRFIKECAVVVVDEMHMLLSPDRGAKLEFSIEKIRYECGEANYPAILGLTTSECDVTYVQNWLNHGRNTKVIANDSRPVEIEERFFYINQDNKLELKCFLNKQETELTDFQLSADTLEVRKNSQITLQFLLSEVLRNHPEDSITIFCNSKKVCNALIGYICSGNVIPRRYVEFDDPFPSELDTGLEESAYQKLKESMREYGVAYHNANLSLSLRNFIEQQFSKRKLRIVIATETLTTGVNMPTDIMILYNYQVVRENNMKELTYQEYKNTIGRAGRLNLSRRNKGISYLLVGKIERNSLNPIEKYIHRAENEIILSGVKESENISLAMALAPFFLNILNNDDFTSEDIHRLIRNGLQKRQKFVPEELADEILSVLQGNNIRNPKKALPILAEVTEDIGAYDNDDEDKYVIKEFGKDMAKFALNLFTCKVIKERFIDALSPDAPIKLRRNHMPVYSKTFPFTLNPEQKDNLKKIPMYFIDVIYQVCATVEIDSNKNNLMILSDNSVESIEVREEIQKKILHFFQTEVKPGMLWPNSILEKYCEKDTTEIPTSILNKLYRTVLMYYWVQGCDGPEIRRRLDLKQQAAYYIYTTELLNFGEMCAYQLEAISQGKRKQKEERYLFYALSIRIKYGMSNELARVANKHIRGLTRAQLLNIEKKFEKQKASYLGIVDFILHQSEKQLELSKEVFKNLCSGLHDTDNADRNRLKETISQNILIRNAEDFFANLDTLEEMDAKASGALYHIFSQLEQPTMELQQNCIQLTSNKLKIYLCTSSRRFTSPEELCETLGIKDTANILILYKSGHVQSNFCISARRFCHTLLKYIATQNTENISKVGESFIEIFRNRSLGKNDLPEEKISQLSSFELKNMGSSLPAENVIIHNTTNYINIVHGDVIETQNNTTYNISSIIYNWNTSINQLKHDFENRIEENPDSDDDFFIEAEKIIQIPEAIPQETLSEKCQKLMQDAVDPTYQEFIDSMSDIEALEKLMLQAVYAESNITDIEELDDYSPAAVLYGKVLECCLRGRLIPYFLKNNPKIPVRMIRSDSRNYPLDDYKKEEYHKFTMGTFYYIIGAHIEKMGYTPKFELWKNLRAEIYNAKEIRNMASHYGQNLPKEGILELRRKTISIIQITKNLP